MKNLVIVPTYNEKENIAALIRAVLVYDSFHVLVVDDGSPDGTAAIVKSTMKEYPDRIYILERSGKMGLGSAYIAGFKYGLSQGYDYIFEMDADFSHDPEDLPRLLTACMDDGADMSIGSRYTKGGGFINWPKERIFISRGGSLYVQLLTFMPIKDPTAGFICYSSKVLNSFDLNKVQLAGYAFQIEMKYVIWKNGFTIKEVPILFKDRELGTSKMSMSIVKEAIWGVIRLVFRNTKKYYAKSV